MEDQEYPPGTVGYLAQGLGWRTHRARTVGTDGDPVLPEARRSTPVPDEPGGDPGDVHTDEDADGRADDLTADDLTADDLTVDLSDRPAEAHAGLFDDRKADLFDDGGDYHFDRLLDDPDADLNAGFPDVDPSAGYPGADRNAGFADPLGVRTGERVVERTQPVPEQTRPAPADPTGAAAGAPTGAPAGEDVGASGGSEVPDEAEPPGEPESPAGSGSPGEPESSVEPEPFAGPGSSGEPESFVEPGSPGEPESFVEPESLVVAGEPEVLTEPESSRAAATPMTDVPAGARWIDPGALAAQQAQRRRNGTLAGDPDLDSARLLHQGKPAPRFGWRRALYVISGKTINVGEGPAEINERELIARINQPLHGCYKIAMLSLKGGVGKTTVTATVGATFASLRGDRVIAVDANPDRGTLSQKIPLETSATVRHLLRDAQTVRRYNDVRAYTSQGPSRLEVLASEQDPAVSEAFSEAEYRRTVALLEHFYNVVLTDCGTGLMHSAMYGVLGLADALVIVSSGSIDGARSASATMDWLDAHGHRDLVANSVAVINSVRRNSGGVDLDRVAEHFAARCRAVVRVPYDPHLEEGAEIDLDRLSVHTRAALLELSAAVADGFPAG